MLKVFNRITLVLVLAVILATGTVNAAPTWEPPVDDAAAVSALLSLLDDDCAEVRLDGLRCLLPLEELISEPQLARALGLLTDPDGRVRATAAGLAFIHGNETAGIPVVLELFADEDPRCREAAANLCADCLEANPHFLEPLIKLVADPDQYVRAAGLCALDVRTDVPAALVPELIGVMQSDEFWLARSLAARVLGRFAVEDAVALDALIAALDDPKPGVVEEVSQALAPLGELALPAIPKLARFLTCPCFYHNYLYIYDVLEELGETPAVRERTTAEVFDYLDNEDTAIVYHACMALNYIETTELRVREKGLAMLLEADADRRQLGGLLLGGLFMDDPAVIPPLAQALSDQDKYVRHQAIVTLMGRGALIAGAADELVDLLNNDYYLPARGAAALALGETGRTDPPVINALKAAAAAADTQLAAAATEALSALGGEHEQE